QPLRLADLVKHGAGDNLHVRLSEFSFGTPIVEKARGQVDGAWIPLFAPGRRAKDATPVALFYARRVKGQAELDDLLKTTTFVPLVASPLPRKHQNMSPSPALYASYPKLDPKKTPVLTEPVLDIPGYALPAEHWFNPNLSYMLWARPAWRWSSGLPLAT